MSRWVYDTAAPPPKAYEAVDAAVTLIKSAGHVVSGTYYLTSTADVYGHEDPVDKPASMRWATVLQVQEIGGRPVSNDGLLKVIIHVKVDGPRSMVNYPAWHAAMHDRISKSLTGKTADLTYGEVGLRYRQITEPSSPQIQPDTDTRMSFAQYAVTLQPNQPE